MSALHPNADIAEHSLDVRQVTCRLITCSQGAMRRPNRRPADVAANDRCGRAALPTVRRSEPLPARHGMRRAPRPSAVPDRREAPPHTALAIDLVLLSVRPFDPTAQKPLAVAFGRPPSADQFREIELCR